ncbi:DUF1572 family protein [Deinococcus peraridilitoris]|uniref:DinB-like domain-containing protein n=1 Tax=Deinococcus peraridilitoris (strain DSM 19664 / LMG 22246 / CIP 109416 / KR-200) TaxID=937777 RepID=K9ZYP2_DEIPD|nr:DUF1572 family protein [Deinococcus peraridilitoris]AFZ66768.1 Protein of unknown function (DUF1572) [Deinococcus peraridilitoris DSM 19664]
MTDLGALFLHETTARLRSVKALGEGALQQLSDDDLHAVPGAESNSAAVLVQHLHGNMRSRWARFPDEDGESGQRRRDAEFEDAGLARAELLALWEAGWQIFFTALARTAPEDLARTITIRGEAHTVLAAIQRQVAHYSGHVYQLVYLAKLLRGGQWQTLSIPRGGSQAYNEAMGLPAADPPGPA